MEINKKNIKEEFSGIRLIAVLTPDTYLRKLIVVSTIMNNTFNSGETAISQVDSLNSLTIDFKKVDGWKVLKKHKSLSEAIDYHNETISSKKFIDCKMTSHNNRSTTNVYLELNPKNALKSYEEFF